VIKNVFVDTDPPDINRDTLTNFLPLDFIGEPSVHRQNDLTYSEKAVKFNKIYVL